MIIITTTNGAYKPRNYSAKYDVIVMKSFKEVWWIASVNMFFDKSLPLPQK